MISEFSLLVFTTFAGLAAGAYAVNVFFVKQEENKKAYLFPLVCIVLLAIGMFGSMMHIGRLDRILFAFSNPTSMICQEAYWSIILGIFMLVDCIMLKVKGTSPRAIGILGAISGLVLICVMGFAYFTSYGNPVWAQLPTLPFFLLGDLAMGAALVAVFKKNLYKNSVFVNLTIVLAGLFAVVLIALILQFGANGYSMTPFIVSLIVAPVATIVLALLVKSDKLESASGAWIICSCVLIGTVIARYAFYAASII